MLQPPPRKVKPTALLKDVQTEQVNKLQEREQQLLDILEDIRQFSKQRSDLERSYGQTLLKLTSQMLSKKELFNLSDIRVDNGPQKRTVNAAWKKVLEETEKLAWQRIKAAEIYTSQVSDPSRLLKDNMATVVKKAMEQLTVLHKDLAQTAADMAASQKVFADDESAAMAARLKAADAEMRLKKRQTSLLTSQGTLQKNTTKSLARRDLCNAKAVHSRNAYLLELAAANAHSMHVHNTDLPSLYTFLDEGVYEEMSSFLQVLGKTEVDVCSAILTGYRGISDFASLVDRDYNLQCFIKTNEAFDIPVHFEYESAVSSEPVRKLSSEYQEQAHLAREARKWAAKQTSEQRTLEELGKAVSRLAPTSLSDSRSLGHSVLSVSAAGKDLKKGPSNVDDADSDVSLDILRLGIQRAEVGKVKAEARLNLLKAAGVNVVAALEQAQSDPAKAGILEASPELSSADREDAMRSINGDNWSFDDDDSFDSFSDSESPTLETLPVGSDPPIRYPYNVTALYMYSASNPDELTLCRGDILEVVHPGDGDGWLKARNAHGHVGLVPGNYVEAMSDSDEAQSPCDVAAHLVVQHPAADAALKAAGSADAGSLRDDASSKGTASSKPADVASVRSGSLYSATDYEVQQALTPKDSGVKAEGVWLRALYDYSASCDEELSFCEGQLIHLISKAVGGVDDGYWQGRVGDRVAVFPSLVVEELRPEQYPTIEQAGLLLPAAPASSAALGASHAKLAASVAEMRRSATSMTRQSSNSGRPSAAVASAVVAGSPSDVGVLRRPSALDFSQCSRPVAAADKASPGGTFEASPSRPTPKLRSASLVADRRSQVEAQLMAVAHSAVTAPQKPVARQPSDGGGGGSSEAVPESGDSRKPAVARRPASLGQPAAAFGSAAVAGAAGPSPCAPQPASSQAVLASILQKSLGCSDTEPRLAERGGGPERAAGHVITECSSRALASSSRPGGFSRSISGHGASQDDAAAIRLRPRSEGSSRTGAGARPASAAPAPAGAAGAADSRRAVAARTADVRQTYPELHPPSATADSVYNPSYRHAVDLSLAPAFAAAGAPAKAGQEKLAAGGRGQQKPAAENAPRKLQFSTPQPVRKSRLPSGPTRKESAV